MTNVAPESLDALARSLTLPCGVVLSNRIAKAAMTEQMAELDNSPNEALMRLYARWAGSGAGLLITGNVMVDRRCLEHARNVAIEDERHLEMLRPWANTGQMKGAQLWMQISHAGRQSPKAVTRQPVAPSEVRLRGLEALFAKPRALTEPEIHDIIRRFATTAAVAQRAGFSGVQIHAAHGYLISEFLSPIVNRRMDDWGGSPENRMRFLLEIVRAVRRAVGAAYPVSVKLNSADFQRGGFSVEESMDVAAALERERIDLLEISGGNYENPAMMGMRQSTREREAYFLDYARAVRQRVATPLMLTGGFRSGAAMRAAVEEGAVDVVGIARPLAVEPDFPARILERRGERAAAVRTRVGIRRLDDMMQSFWFNQQMHRMARGLEPDLNRSRLLTLMIGVKTNLIWNPFRRGA